MEILLITIGKTSTKYIREGIDIYISRLKHYIPFRTLELPDVKRTSSLTEIRQKEIEGEAFLSHIAPYDYVTLLDERGASPTSRQFADIIEKHQVSGRKRVVFLVGGPYGFSPKVYERADSQISLSKMTFSHEMVRLFFIEQVYRACTILRGEPYHHD